MSKPSEIAHNVWLGPTPDASITSLPGYQIETRSFDVFIEASDLAQVPQSSTLAKMANVLEQTDEPQYMDFPSSGSIVAPSWSQSDADGILETCKWIYELANPREDGAPEMDCDGDSTMACRMPTPRRILVHCADGYTESSMLGLAYYMYAEGVSIHEAWLQLHCDKERNFFAYPSDVALLAGIQARLLEQSPFRVKSPAAEPDWLGRMDGSLPSRILSYMYLGNLPHANNPELLKALGVCQVLSIGESVSWSASERQEWGSENLLFIDRVQDNGVDPLTDEFDRCLEFIGTSL
jgi:dual specificity MAP kinase phosphatase